MLTLLNESLWGDEGFSAIAVQRGFFEMIGVVMRDTAPPLFYILGFIWVRIFGHSEIALRSLSMLLMVGASVFAGLTVGKISKNKILGVLGGFLAFFSPFLIPFAFEWRMYALLTFTVSASIYFFAMRNWKWYVVFSVASLYTHHFSIFTLAGQGLWFLIFEFDWKKHGTYLKQLKPFLLIGALYIPWLYPMYLQTTRVQGAGFWLAAPKPKEVTDLAARFLTGGVKEQWVKLTWVLVVLIYVFKDWKKYGKKWSELMFVVLMPIAGSVVVSYLVTPIFYDRYLLSVAVGMAVLLVLGTKRRAWPIILVFLVIYFNNSLRVFTSPNKRPFREFAEYVKTERDEVDLVINHNGKAHHLWETKYYGIEAPIYTPDGPLPLYVGTAQMEEGDTLEEIPEEVEKLGVITSDDVGKVNLSSEWMVESVKEFGELKFVEYERVES